jgi:hypothetical protein
MVDEVTVSSWNQLNELVYEGSWQERLDRFRPRYAFRGQGDAAKDLHTSLSRLGGPPELEGHLLRNFRKYAQRTASGGECVWTWLAIAQHHGLPTRLLDWTFSPYVAMHFATADVERFDTDAAIWCVDFGRTNELLPERLRAILTEEGSDVFTAEMLLRASRTLQEFDKLSETDFVAFFEPPSLDDRIVVQFALFSLMSNPRLDLDAWLGRHQGTCRRIIIPARLKWEVRDKLDQANITERVLYGGLDGLSAWLKRYYLPRK